MARYPNGRIPKRLLVHLGGDHWLTPATKVRWDRLVADVLKNEGIRLQITGGPNAYRDIEWQRYYWNTLPYPQAAYPGTSSHGGEYNGRDSMAIDVANWGMIGKNTFYSYARKHGFEPNFFDWEPWHIIDWTPWSVPSGGGSTPAPIPEPIPEEDEDEAMAKMKGAYWTRARDKKVEYMLFNEESGFHVEHTTVPGGYNNTIAENWETNSWSPITEAHSVVLKNALDRVLVKKITGAVSVDITDTETLPQ